MTVREKGIPTATVAYRYTVDFAHITHQTKQSVHRVVKSHMPVNQSKQQSMSEDTRWSITHK